MAKDYYQVLDISRNATEEQVKKAYRKLAMKSFTSGMASLTYQYRPLFKV